MGYRSHDVKPELKKIVDLEDEAEQAESLADLERQVELEKESQEIKLRFRKKGIDLVDDYSTLKQLTEEVRENVKPVSTAKRLLKKHHKKLAAALAITLAGITAAPLLFEERQPAPHIRHHQYYHIFNIRASKVRSLLYEEVIKLDRKNFVRHFDYKRGFVVDTKAEYEKHLEEESKRWEQKNKIYSTTKEFEMKADTNCDHLLTLQEFADSYRRVTGRSDLNHKWKLSPEQLKGQAELDVDSVEGIRIYYPNKIKMDFDSLSKLNEKLPETDCRVYIK